ncbi:hypothetical protein ACH4TJ_19625 [Streptomyces echinatus]|uniref:hypothetical protein n=1 Tax=Streptomyces echinatus TaxID=67293 RepID=UPI00378CA4E6
MRRRESAGEDPANEQVEQEAPAAAGRSAAADGPVALPDEQTFRMPAAWRRLVYPRRGGIERSVAGPHPETEQRTAFRLHEEADWIEAMLTAPKSDPRIVEATRSHMDGRPNPLGAAVVATLTFQWQYPDGIFVDAWVRAHGLAFAAQAVVEYFDVVPHYHQSGAHRENPWLGFAPERPPAATGRGRSSPTACAPCWPSPTRTPTRRRSPHWPAAGPAYAAASSCPTCSPPNRRGWTSAAPTCSRPTNCCGRCCCAR